MSDSRYDDILRRIAKRKLESEMTPALDELSSALDGLNALGFLEEVRRRPPPGIACYGPKVFKGFRQSETVQPWIATVIWCKPRGYYHYQVLTVVGVWAYPDDGVVTVMLGTKQFQFSAPIFNPESYYHHLKRGFDVYYSDDVSPPPDSLYRVAYDPAQRLAIREQLQAELKCWTGQQIFP